MGTVTKYFKHDRYGFVRSKETDAVFTKGVFYSFAHHSRVLDGADRVGTKMRFNIAICKESGRPQAVNLKVLLDEKQTSQV